MIVQDKKTVDPFDNINLDDFKNQPTESEIVIQQIPEIDKSVIKGIAEENNFKSREVSQKKEKIITKTFSLFKDECNIINKTITHCLSNSYQDPVHVSGSDVVRAALYLLSQQPNDEQINLILQHRGRGRK